MGVVTSLQYIQYKHDAVMIFCFYTSGSTLLTIFLLSNFNTWLRLRGIMPFVLPYALAPEFFYCSYKCVYFMFALDC